MALRKSKYFPLGFGWKLVICSYILYHWLVWLVMQVSTNRRVSYELAVGRRPYLKRHHKSAFPPYWLPRGSWWCQNACGGSTCSPLLLHCIQCELQQIHPAEDRNIVRGWRKHRDKSIYDRGNQLNILCKKRSKRLQLRVQQVTELPDKGHRDTFCIFFNYWPKYYLAM